MVSFFFSFRHAYAGVFCIAHRLGVMLPVLLLYDCNVQKVVLCLIMIIMMMMIIMIIIMIIIIMIIIMIVIIIIPKCTITSS